MEEEPTLLDVLKIIKVNHSDLEDKVDDLENCLRRNNLRLVGLPEAVEVSDPVSFLECWFTQEFGKDCLSPALSWKEPIEFLADCSLKVILPAPWLSIY